MPEMFRDGALTHRREYQQGGIKLEQELSLVLGEIRSVPQISKPCFSLSRTRLTLHNFMEAATGSVN
jgi:hypothetical protein